MTTSASGQDVEELVRFAVDAAFHVRRSLGPGLLEHVYEECTALELEERRISFKRRHPLATKPKNQTIENAFRVDLLIGGCLNFELRAVKAVLPVRRAQVLTYLRLSGIRLGFLINFNVPVIKAGIQRLAL